MSLVKMNEKHPQQQEVANTKLSRREFFTRFFRGATASDITTNTAHSESVAEHTPEPRPLAEPYSEEQPTRRSFLKMMGAIGIGPYLDPDFLWKLLTNREVQLAVKASYIRTSETKKLEQANPLLEMRLPSDEAL